MRSLVRKDTTKEERLEDSSPQWVWPRTGSRTWGLSFMAEDTTNSIGRQRRHLDFGVSHNISDGQAARRQVEQLVLQAARHREADACQARL